MFVCKICGPTENLPRKSGASVKTYCEKCGKTLIDTGKVKYSYKMRSFYDVMTGKKVGAKAQASNWKHGHFQHSENADRFHTPAFVCAMEGADWKICRCDKLLAEIHVETEDILFFLKLLTNNPDHFRFCQYQYGIWPLVVSSELSPGEARAWDLDELCHELNITKEIHRQYVDAVAGGWRGFKKLQAPGKMYGTMETKATSKVKEALNEAKIVEMFRKYRFPESIFKMTGREDDENKYERQWFAERVLDWQKLLDEPTAFQLTRQLLMKEMDLERIRMELMKRLPSDENYGPLQKVMAAKEAEYQVMWQQLHDAYPIAGAIAKKTSVTGILSDMVAGLREFYSNADNQIIDGLFTALEIQVLLRQSEQLPTPQYRPSLVAATNEAMAHLWDKDWRSCFDPADLKKLDLGWKTAIAALHEETVPNLLAEGKSGEYKPLIQPSAVFEKNEEEEEQETAFVRP